MASQFTGILAEGAIALSVTLSGGALVANLKLFQVLSSLIVKVILAICMRASDQSSISSAAMSLWGEVEPMLFLREGVCVMLRKVVALVYVVGDTCCCFSTWPP